VRLPARKVAWVAGIVACAAAMILARESLLQFALSWLDVGTQPAEVDCVLVLGGDVSTRPFVAASLAKLGLARRVLVPRTLGTGRDIEGIVGLEDELTCEVLRRRGVPREAITLIGQPCAHTQDEARALGDYLKASPSVRAAVVTSGYHTRRARWVFRSVLGRTAERVSFVSAPWDDFPRERWWRDPSGASAVLGEYLKLAFYVCYYGSGLYWLASLVLVVVVLTVLARRRKACAVPASP
jgi:uncharacterized SAM-binding protein YcdF (DUF218 family)